MILATQKDLMKKNKECWVCYDGKHSRKVPGVFLFNFFNLVGVVKFKEWASDEDKLVSLFVWKQPLNWKHPFQNFSFGGYLKTKNSFMKAFFGLPGDWYSVFPKEKIK